MNKPVLKAEAVTETAQEDKAIRARAVVVVTPWFWKQGRWEGQQWVIPEDGAYNDLVDRLSNLSDVSHVKYLATEESPQESQPFGIPGQNDSGMIVIFPQENVDVSELRAGVADTVRKALKAGQSKDKRNPLNRSDVAVDRDDEVLAWLDAGNARIYSADLAMLEHAGQVQGLPEMSDTFAMSAQYQDFSSAPEARVENAVQVVKRFAQRAQQQNLDAQAVTVVGPGRVRVFVSGDAIASDSLDAAQRKLYSVYDKAVTDALGAHPSGITDFEERKFEVAGYTPG